MLFSEFIIQNSELQLVSYRTPALRAGRRHIHASRYGAVDRTRYVIFKVLRAANDNHPRAAKPPAHAGRAACQGLGNT